MPAGLPGFLVGSYKRYKSDTNQFLEWLDRTAKECSPPVKEVKFKPSMSQAAKKKVRRQWKEKTPVHMRPLPTDKVALSHFVTLARIIADSGRQIRVPRLVAVLISRAIALQANRGHAHFVAVLEEVLQILEEPFSRSEASQERKNSNKASEDGIDALVNRFSVLDLEEAEEPDVDGQKVAEESTEPSKPAVKASQKANVDVFDDTERAENGEREEAIFAVFCLFEDLRKLHDFIKQIWQDYKEQKIDLVSAAVTTNTAIDIARQSSEDFLDKHRVAIRLLKKEMPSDDSNLAFLFYNFVGMQLSVEPWETSRKNASWNVKLDEVADYCFLPSCTLLMIYVQGVRTPGDIPTYNKGWAYDRVSEMDRKDMSSAERWKEDQEISLSSFTSFAFLGKGSLPVPGQDELTKGLRKMEQSGATPFWLAFAMQIYLDIHHLLRKEVRRGFLEARQHARRARDKINAYFAFSEKLEKNPFWKSGNDALFRGVCKDIEMWFDHDIFGAVQNNLARVVSADEEDEFEFLKWHPLLMGMMAFNINLRVQELGRTLVNVWGSVIYPAYLYNAIQQEGVVDLHWPDMDKILEFHGEDKLFFGGKPRTLQDSITKVALATGMSAQAMAAAKNGRKVDWEKFKSSRGQRGLEESTVIADLFRDRHTRYGAVDFTVANVERVLNEFAAADSAKTGERLSSRKFLKRRWEATQKLTPLQLLAALHERLVDEESKLNFDYLGMHQRGIDLLKAIHGQEKDKLRQYFGAEYLVRHDYELGGVVPYLFKASINSAAARQELGVDQIPGIQATSGILIRAGKIMQDFSKEHEDDACAKLRDICINKTGLTYERPAQEQILNWIKLDELLDIRALEVLGQLR